MKTKPLRINKADRDFLKKIGGGSVSHGLELVVELARAAEKAFDLRQGERMTEKTKIEPYHPDWGSIKGPEPGL